MNAKNFKAYIFVLLLFGCQEPIDFTPSGEDQAILIVSGSISDQEGFIQTLLTKNPRINELGLSESDPVLGALVSLAGDNGESYELIGNIYGQYVSREQHILTSGVSYKLVIELEGKRYESIPQRLPEVIADTELSFDPDVRQRLNSRGTVSLDVEGVKVSANVPVLNRKAYYKWFNYNYFIIEEAHSGDRCFVSNFSPERFSLLEVNAGSPGRVSTEIAFIENGLKLEVDYALQANQQVINEETYEYFRKVKEQSERTGTLFDPVPQPILGNIFNVEDDLEVVLGHFYLYRFSFDRIFFNQSELPFTPTREGCPYQPNDHEWCGECRNYNGGINVSQTRPEWWR